MDLCINLRQVSGRSRKKKAFLVHGTVKIRAVSRHWIMFMEQMLHDDKPGHVDSF